MRLGDLYWIYHERVQFLVIYIREAHPQDGWSLSGGVPGAVLRLMKSRAAVGVADPRTLGERLSLATKCEDTLQYGIPTLVDDVDDRVSRAYAARPTRLYLVDTQGVVSYAGGLGPFGFKPTELKNAIEVLLPPTLSGGPDAN